jgi:hypothetical protein
VREIFRRVVQLDPDLTLDRAKYPEGLVQIFDSVRTPMVRGPQGKVQVLTKPGPAIVYLDGRKRGIAPLELVNISPGSHSLAVVRPGFVPFERTIDVTSFRVDTHVTALTPDRYPALAKIFDAGGEAAKDEAGATASDWLAAIAEAAELDVVFVGLLEGDALRVRAWTRAAKTLLPVMEMKRPASSAGVLTGPAGALLEDAAAKSAIPALAARLRPERGGGALDTNRPWAIRTSLSSLGVVQSAGRNLPDAPPSGVRVAIERRVGGRVVAAATSGVDFANDSHVVLKDGSGNLASGAGPVGALLLSVPLELSARGYASVGTWAPFLAAGGGITFDTIQWREGLAEDRITSRAGAGFTGFAGAGVDRALDSRSALSLEARWQVGKLGATDGTVHVSGQPSRSFPVGGETYGGVRVSLGYLRTF